MSNVINIPSNSTPQMVREGSASASTLPAPLPAPRCAISVRVATSKDATFIDALQKMHTHMVGWMPGKQIEGKIAAGHVLIAEEVLRGEGRGASKSPVTRKSSLAPDPSPLAPVPLGYLISQDQYMGRDDCGIVYQLNVVPMKQRHLVGASLIKACFDRAAYGCRLFCCWCAQDIQANYFWESIGFVPLAFRTGSRSKQRIHIFWQRRIREGDVTTPYWYPAQTRAGSLREDRLVLPIPIGTNWRDAKPVLLPGLSNVEGPGANQPKALPPTRPPAPAISQSRKMAIIRSESKHLKGLKPGKAAVVTAGGIKYIERGDYVPEVEPAKPKRAPSAPKQKNDPKLVAGARELRDRWLEEVNSGRYLPQAAGKYEISRQLEAAPMVSKQFPLLPAA